MTNIVTISNYICKTGFSARIGKKTYFQIFEFFLDVEGRGGYSETTSAYLIFSSCIFFLTQVYQYVVSSVLISSYTIL